MKNLIIGMGYVGTITAYSMNKLGHEIICLEKDKCKVEMLRSGKAPFYEPGLTDIINEAGENVTIYEEIKDINLNALDFIFICVGTPSDKNGNLNLQYVYEAVESIIKNPTFQEETSIVIRSTIETGTITDLNNILSRNNIGGEILFHPEFLREGSALKDFFQPPFVVCSNISSPIIETKFNNLYKDIKNVTYASPIDLELLKLTCNNWHALKVGFANEIGQIANVLGANAKNVMDIFCKDDILNISKAYLRPGFAFGGSCLPKDNRSLSVLAKKLNLSIIPSINQSNSQIIQIFKNSLLDTKLSEINWIGVTFKENSDDCRESPYLLVLKQLLSQSEMIINVFDPLIESSTLQKLLNIEGNSNRIIIHKKINTMNDKLPTYLAHSYKDLNLSEVFEHLNLVE